jgi:23S rRNA pseudouridine1911/1915/1917 synthase
VTGRLEKITYQNVNAERLDRYLSEKLPEFTRSRLQAFIKEGLVTVNDVAVTKTGFRLEGEGVIHVAIPAVKPAELIPEEIPLSVIFENNDMLVINKPAGMVVHPAAGHDSGTLVHAALAHAPEMDGIGGEIRPGVVHRLDKETSGLILMAKNDSAHQWLQNQFRDRQVEKYYLALVDGHLPTPKGRVEAPVGRDPSHRKRMAIVPAHRGREAVSEYRTLQVFENHTLVEVQIFTGRTHQIRLHMAFLECPIAGDRLYGHRHSTVPLKRHFLHAARMVIRIPGEDQPRIFEAPLPLELQNVLDELS